MALVHGGDVVGFQEEFGIEPIDFSANVNAFGVPNGVKQAIITAIDSADIYPDPKSRKLKAAIAHHDNLSSDNIICGNGAADIIFRLVLAKKPKRALITAPTFAEYEQALACVDCSIQKYELLAQSNFDVQEDFLDMLCDFDIVFLCNPNNPTGKLIAPELLEKIAIKCNSQNITLVVDECFNEFLENKDKHSLIKSIPQNKNLVILKAFTKLYAMAGVRLGYAVCSNAELLDKMEKCGQPWSVSSLAQAAGIAALDEIEYVDASLSDMQVEREYLRQSLLDLNIDVIGHAANYIFFKTDVVNLGEKLKQRGILVRDCSNYDGLTRGYYRIGVKKHNANKMLIETICKILKYMNWGAILWQKQL